MDMDNFKRAFGARSSGCRELCHCGVQYYDSSYDGGWTWEDGELEALEEDEEAIGVEWAVQLIRFEGRDYVMDCDCWRDRARRIMGFLDSHIFQVAKYINREKKRLLDEAKMMPDVDLDDNDLGDLELLSAIASDLQRTQRAIDLS